MLFAGVEISMITDDDAIFSLQIRLMPTTEETPTGRIILLKDYFDQVDQLFETLTRADYSGAFEEFI